MTLKAAVLILMQPDITIHTPSLVLHCFALLYYILLHFLIKLHLLCFMFAL